MYLELVFLPRWIPTCVGLKTPCPGEQSAHQYTLALVGKRLKKGVSSENTHSTSTIIGQTLLQVWLAELKISIAMS